MCSQSFKHVFVTLTNESTQSWRQRIRLILPMFTIIELWISFDKDQVVTLTSGTSKTLIYLLSCLCIPTTIPKTTISSEKYDVLAFSHKKKKNKEQI